MAQNYENKNVGYKGDKDLEKSMRYIWTEQNGKYAQDLDKKNNVNGLLEKIIRQGSQNLKDQIELIEALIQERVKLNEKALRELEHERGKLEGLLNETKGFGMYSTLNFSPRRTSLEKQMTDIEKHKLLEEIKAFKDIARMQEKLHYLKAKYKEDKNRFDLIVDGKDKSSYEKEK
jgi:hypothetical protein